MMVFNPVYIQKSNEGDLQLLGSGFSNQKPTHLFSDIIKVILSKTDQPENIISINGKEQSPLSTGEYPLMITDSEVELFDNFMKMGLSNNLNPDDVLDVNPGIDWDNLKMFLNGLADKDENSSVSEEGTEINKTDLLVVLNIFAGNIIEQNSKPEANENMLEEIKNFISTVNALAEQLSGEETKNIVISQGEYSISLSAQDNGKFLINLNDAVTKENIKLATGEIKTGGQIKTEFAEVKNESVKMKNGFTPELAFTEENSELLKTKSNVELDGVNTKNATSAKFENYINSKTTDVYTKNTSKKDIVENVNTSGEDSINSVSKPELNKAKVAFVIEKNAEVNQTAKTSVKNLESVNPKSLHEFFQGKIKVEVKDVNVGAVKEEPKIIDGKLSAAVNTDAEKKLVVNETNIKAAFKDSDSVVKAASGKISVSENNTYNKTALFNGDEKQIPNETGESNFRGANDKLNNENPQPKNAAKEIKFMGSNAESEIVKDNVKTVQTENANQNVVAESVHDKKLNIDKTNADKTEAEKISGVKQKSAKSVLGSKDAEQQKPDNSQNQNSFEKVFVNANKAEQVSKEFKETVRVVEQSRLMNELENIIKSGERKTVTINLHPEDLGTVRVSLDVNDKNVSAKINVANEQVRQIILTQSENLKSSLSQNGIQLASLNVSVNNPDEKANPNAKSSKRKDGSIDKKLVIKDIPNPVKVKNLGYNTYDYVV